MRTRQPLSTLPGASRALVMGGGGGTSTGPRPLAVGSPLSQLSGPGDPQLQPRSSELEAGLGVVDLRPALSLCSMPGQVHV